MEFLTQITVNFRLHLLRKGTQFCKLPGSKWTSDVPELDEPGNNQVEVLIDVEDGLINPQPLPTAKMGTSHDARSVCVVVRTASVCKHWRSPFFFIAEP